MKTKNFKYILAAGLVCCGLTTTFSSCGDVLDEQPRSQFDPTYFNTKAGIEGGLTSLYAHLRYFYGNGYYLNSLETGTDEYTYAQSADGNFKDADLSGVGSLTPTSSVAGGAWGTLFANINTCSGVIEMVRLQVLILLCSLRLTSSVGSTILYWYRPMVVFPSTWVLVN